MSLLYDYFQWSYLSIRDCALKLSRENLEEALKYLKGALLELERIYEQKISDDQPRLDTQYPAMKDTRFDPFSPEEQIHPGLSADFSGILNFKVYAHLERMYRLLLTRYREQNRYGDAAASEYSAVSTGDELADLCKEINCHLPSFEYYLFNGDRSNPSVWKDPLKAGKTLTLLEKDDLLEMAGGKLNLLDKLSNNKWGAILQELRQLSVLTGKDLVQRYFLLKGKTVHYSELAGRVIYNNSTREFLEKYCPYSKKFIQHI